MSGLQQDTHDCLSNLIRRPNPSHFAATCGPFHRIKRWALRILAGAGFGRFVWAIAVSAALASELAGQSAGFSSSAEYKSMLTELASETPRPTRLSGAGELLQGKLPMAPVEVKETPEGLRLEAETWRLEMNKKPWQLLLTSKRTNVAWRLATSGPSGGGISWVAKDGATSLRLTQVEQIEGRNGQWTVRGKVEGSQTPSLLNISVLAPGIIHLFIGAPESGEKAGLKLGFSGPGPFFGLGERFSKARLDGQKITLHPEDKGFEGTEHNWTYIPAPFLFTPLGLGIYLDTGTESVFDLTQAARQQFTIQLKRPAVNCYFFVGDPKGIIRDYTGLTGRTPVPPPWAFGVWLTSLQGGGPVLSNALRLRELGIPTSALWVWDVMDDERLVCKLKDCPMIVKRLWGERWR